MTTAIVILVMLTVLGYFYLKCSVMASLSTMIILIIATILTFSYYEKLAELFVSRGYGVQWAHMGCFILIFVLSFALLRALRDLLVGGAAIDLGNPADIRDYRLRKHLCRTGIDADPKQIPVQPL